MRFSSFFVMKVVFTSFFVNFALYLVLLCNKNRHYLLNIMNS